MVVILARQAGNRFLGSLIGFQIRAQARINITDILVCARRGGDTDRYSCCSFLCQVISLTHSDFQIFSDKKDDVFSDLCGDLWLEYEWVYAAEGVVVRVLPAPRLRVYRIRLHGHVHVTSYCKTDWIIVLGNFKMYQYFREKKKQIISRKLEVFQLSRADFIS